MVELTFQCRPVEPSTVVQDGRVRADFWLSMSTRRRLLVAPERRGDNLTTLRCGTRFAPGPELWRAAVGFAMTRSNSEPGNSQDADYSAGGRAVARRAGTQPNNSHTSADRPDGSERPPAIVSSRTSSMSFGRNDGARSARGMTIEMTMAVRSWTPTPATNRSPTNVAMRIPGMRRT